MEDLRNLLVTINNLDTYIKRHNFSKSLIGKEVYFEATVKDVNFSYISADIYPLINKSHDSSSHLDIEYRENSNSDRIHMFNRGEKFRGTASIIEFDLLNIKIKLIKLL